MEKYFEGIDDIDELIGEYGSKSDDELMQELIEVTSQQKLDGTFSESDVEMMENLIMPMLDEAQAARLTQILEAIK